MALLCTAQARSSPFPPDVNRRDRHRPVWDTAQKLDQQTGKRMYQAVTRNIQVTVEPQFLPDESDADSGRFFFAYSVEIANLSGAIVQVRTRHWTITDGLGRVQEVNGPGVVGEEPILHPGESYRYTSGCPLETPTGIMVGKYGVETLEGSKFLIDIPAFSLDAPFYDRTLN
ncbi:MAG: Co2+/Mg2+ efflux protein ApaG [Pseudomonadota bacterium]